MGSELDLEKWVGILQKEEGQAGQKEELDKDLKARDIIAFEESDE